MRTHIRSKLTSFAGGVGSLLALSIWGALPAVDQHPDTRVVKPQGFSCHHTEYSSSNKVTDLPGTQGYRLLLLLSSIKSSFKVHHLNQQ